MLEGVADSLLWALIDDRSANERSTVPMIIVGHSLGGSFGKQLFVASSPSRNSRPEIQELHSCIAGYLFFGTVQEGSYPKNLVQTAKWRDPDCFTSLGCGPGDQ